MNKRILLVLFSLALSGFLFTTLGAARSVLIGDNKGKEVLSQLEQDQKNAETVINGISEIIKNGSETQKLLVKMIENMEKQQQTNQAILGILAAQQKAAAESKPEQEQSGTKPKTDGLATLIELQKNTNLLLKQLIEEQKWTGAVIQGQLQNKNSNIGKPQ